jgi:hypothetical protein
MVIASCCSERIDFKWIFFVKIAKPFEKGFEKEVAMSPSMS